MPQSIFSRAARKCWDRNSSSLIISLLGTPVSCVGFTEEEAIVACLLHLALGPYKILQGLSMVMVGLILAPIPFVVGLVETCENVSPHYKTASVEGISLILRSPNHPCHYNSVTYAHDINGIFRLANEEYGTAASCYKGWAAVSEIPQAYANEPFIPRSYFQTVTGYNLITAGLVQTTGGVWSTVKALPWAALRSLNYLGKKAINRDALNQNMPGENAHIAYRL